MLNHVHFTDINGGSNYAAFRDKKSLSIFFIEKIKDDYIDNISEFVMDSVLYDSKTISDVDKLIKMCEKWEKY